MRQLKNVKLQLGMATAGFTAVCLASSAMAGFTAINDSSPSFGSEPTPAEILNALTGSSLTLGGGGATDINLGAGFRVHDFSPPAGQLTDQIWGNGGATAEAAAIYWNGNGLGDPFGGANNQTLGGTNAIGTTETDNIFTTGTDFSNGGSVALSGVLDVSKSFHFAAENEGNGKTADTVMANNAGGLDKVVTFDLWALAQSEGLGAGDTLTLGDNGEVSIELSAPAAGKSHYIFFAETGSDNDFQDAVWVVTNIHPVPLPAPVALAGLGLIGVVAGRRRLRKMVSA